MRLESVQACPVCGRERGPTKRELGAWKTLQCPECTLEYLDPRPAKEDVLAQYDGEDYYVSGNSEHGYSDYDRERLAIAATSRRRLALVRPSSRGDEWLEVGAGFGYFIETALAAGLRMEAAEVSSAAVKRLGGLGIPVHHGELEGLDFRSRYDAIAFFDVLEHLYEPRAFVDAAHRALRPGGILVFTTPDTRSLSARAMGSKWWSYKVPEHLLYFNDGSLQRLLAGKFVMERAIQDRQSITLGGAARRAARLHKSLSVPLRAAIRLAGEDRLVQVPNGMKLYIARKVEGRDG